jgi:pyruvate formate lyase activating enzyme
MNGLVFNIQKFSIHDGPGIRTTVFMKGCPLACKWCSNPESINPLPEIITYDIRCIGCARCRDACPQNAISISDQGRNIDWEKCNQCLACAQACPAKAIEVTGQYMMVDEVMKKICDDIPFYKNSGGGATISGGEALLQKAFVKEIFHRCRENDINTVLDTTGLAPWEHIEDVIQYVDLVLLDIKHMDAATHKAATGVGNALILENAEKIAAEKRTWFRFPLIPGINDSKKNIEAFSAFAAKCDVEKVSLLAYHEWGAAKYEKLGRTYALEGVEAPSEKCVEAVGEMIKSFGLTVDIGQ